LFLNYCFPSVKNQSCQNFKWLVFFDIGTPKKYVGLVEELKNSYPNFIPLFIDGSKELNSSLTEFVSERKKYHDFILMNRIDNDDIIHKDFVRNIQIIARSEHNLVIDVRKGYQLVMNHDLVEYRICEQKFNPFISIVQRAEQYVSIFSRQHTEWEKEENIIIYNEKPLWIQVIHGRNKLNK